MKKIICFALVILGLFTAQAGAIPPSPALMELNADGSVGIVGDRSLTMRTTDLQQSMYRLPDSLMGGNIQNTLSKLRSKAYVHADPVEIVIMGDSITATTGGWADQLVTYLQTTYGSDSLTITRLDYGGYAMEQFVCMFEQAIASNPSMIIFSEYESNAPYRNGLYEQVLQLARSRSSADIVLCTWGASLAAVTTDIANWNTSTLTQAMNFVRAMAKKYGCELVDFNQALYRKALSGATMASYYSDSVHLNTDGHTQILYPEILKHFQAVYSQFSLPNPLADLEQRYHLGFPLAFPSQAPGLIDLSGGTWTYEKNTASTAPWHGAIKSSTDTDYFEVDFEGIGIEVGYVPGDSATHAVKIDTADPSAVTVNGYPLEYGTVIVPKVAAHNENTHFHRPFKAIPTVKLLTNGETSREFEITISEVTRSSGTLTACTYTLKDITQNEVWTGPLGGGKGSFFQDSLFSEFGGGAGRILIPALVGGYANYIDLGDGTNIIEVGDTYQFYVKPNWVDTFDVDDRVAGTEKVLNGGYETGDPPTSWTALSAGAVIAAAADARTGSAGTACLLVTRGADSTSCYQNRTSGVLEVGKTYRVSGWLKNVDAGTGAQLVIADGGNTTSHFISGYVTATEWTPVTGTFVANDTGFRVWPQVYGTAGQQAKFDDISIMEVSDTGGDVGKVKILGLENKPHTLRITKSSGTESKFTDIRVFRPLLGRKSN